VESLLKTATGFSSGSVGTAALQKDASMRLSLEHQRKCILHHIVTPKKKKISWQQNCVS
jgi:hypothetical protein